MWARRGWTLVVAFCLATACSQPPAATGEGPGQSTALRPPPAEGSTSSVPAEWADHSDPSGVQLAHPVVWAVEPGAAGPLIVYIDPAGAGSFRRNINGILQPVHGVTLDQFVQTSNAQLDQLQAVIASQGETTFAGTPAYEWRYRAKVGSLDLAFWAIVTMRGDQPWLFTYTSDPARFDDSLADVATVFSSVRLPG